MEWIADFNRQWTYMLWLIAALACMVPVRRKLGLLPAAALLWFVAGGVATWQNSFGTYDRADQATLLAIQAFSLDSVAKLAAVAGAVVWASDRYWFEGRIRIALSLFCIANAAVIFAQFVAGVDQCRTNECGGLVGNPSMSGGFMVAALPLLFPRATRIGKAITVLVIALAVLATRASSPLGLLAVAMALSIHSRIAPLIAAGMLGVGYAVLGNELLNSGDRFEMWRQFLAGWSNPVNWAFGIGIGQFGIAAALLQFSRDVKTNSWWLWAHNDWLQLLLEGGAVGVVLMLCLWLQGMLRAHREAALSLFLYGLMMLTNYPLHLASTAAFGCWLLVLALTRGKEARHAR